MLASARLWLSVQILALVIGGAALALSLRVLDDAYAHQYAVGVAVENLELTVEARIDEELGYRSLRRVSADDQALQERADRLRELAPDASGPIDALLEAVIDASPDERWWFFASGRLEDVSRDALRPTGQELSDARARTWRTLWIAGGVLAIAIVGRHLFTPKS